MPDRVEPYAEYVAPPDHLEDLWRALHGDLWDPPLEKVWGTMLNEVRRMVEGGTPFADEAERLRRERDIAREEITWLRARFDAEVAP